MLASNRLTATDLAEVLDSAMAAVKDKVQEERPGKWGGRFLFIAPKSTRLIALALAFPGQLINMEELPIYIHHSDDKAGRLIANPDHIAASQSEQVSDDPNTPTTEQHYLGAIRTNDGYILSFSGFPALLDELFCLIVATKLGIIDEQRRNAIIKLSNNHHARDYFGIAA